jgi:hypothetical protein
VAAGEDLGKEEGRCASAHLAPFLVSPPPDLELVSHNHRTATQPTIAAAWQPCASQRCAEPRMLASVPGPSDAPARCLQELANGGVVPVLCLHANGAVDKHAAPPASALLTPGAELDCRPLHSSHTLATLALARLHAVSRLHARADPRAACALLLFFTAPTRTPDGSGLAGLRADRTKA